MFGGSEFERALWKGFLVTVAGRMLQVRTDRLGFRPAGSWGRGYLRGSLGGITASLPNVVEVPYLQRSVSEAVRRWGRGRGEGGRQREACVALAAPTGQSPQAALLVR